MSGGVTREIITLQIGNYANYVGAHYFNLQDPTLSHNADIDHGILWRQVLQQRNPIWTPRVLIFDLKDNYWSYRQSQATTTSTPTTTHFPPQPPPSTSLLQNSQNQNQCESNSNRGILWDGAVQYVDLRDEPVTPTPGTSTSTSGTGLNSKNKEKTRATQEENGKTGSEVKSWVDYTQWKLHWSQEKEAENRFSLPNFSHNPNSPVVSNYGQGLQIYTDMEDRITEAIRRYAEPCDYFQGFHVLADQEDGFGGLASGILQHISDEYEKKTSFCFGLSRPRPAAEEQFEDFKLRSLSTSLVWNSFSLHSSVFTSLGLTDDLFRANPQPVQLPHLNYNPDSAFESSAVLAAALDTLTLPYLQKSSKINFSQLIDLLSGYGHKMTMVGSSFPFPLSHPETLFDVLSERGLDDLHSLTPGAPIDLNKSIGNFFVPRGFSLDQVIRRKEESRRGSGWHQGGSRRDEDGIRDAESCLEVYAQENFRKSVNVVRSIPTPFKLSHPFPALFTPTIFQTLNKSRAPVPSPWYSSTSTPGTSVSSAGEFVWETPTIASAHNSRSVGDLLQRLVDVEVNTKKNSISSRSLLNRIPMMELDDYQECLDNLKVLRETYQDEY